MSADERVSPSPGPPAAAAQPLDHAAGASTVAVAPIVIQAGGRGLGVALRDVWAYRELLYFLAWRDVKVRYKQTALGVLWAVIQPLFLMLAFTLFFGRLAGVPSDGVPYHLFAYAGLLPWTFVANAVTNSGNSLVGSANLITKVYFPRVLIPAAGILAGLVDLLIAALVLVVLAAAAGRTPGAALVAFPAAALLAGAVALGVGLWASALNVRYRDVRYALPFLVQLWMFVTPVIYPSSLLPERWRWLLLLNPMAGVVDAHRAAFLGVPLDATLLAGSAVAAAAAVLSGAAVFRRMERSFADVI